MKEQTSYHIPGIIHIYCVNCPDLLPEMKLKFQAGIPVSVLADGVGLRHFGTPTLKVETDHDNNGQVQKTTLSFTCDSVLPPGDLGFVVVTAVGKEYLIGSKEPPYPAIKQTLASGSPGDTSAVWQIEVTLTDFVSIIKCAGNVIHDESISLPPETFL